jgi:hypothetical protein
MTPFAKVRLCDRAFKSLYYQHEFSYTGAVWATNWHETPSRIKKQKSHKPVGYAA